MTGTTGYAPLSDLAVYYEIHGTGSPLVLLHGGALTIDLSFGPLVGALAQRHQVIAIELQGHGHTADRAEPGSIASFAADVIGVLDHLGVDQADLFGYSLGGLVAAQVGLDHPDRVGKLALAATHFHPDGYKPEITDPAQTSDLLPTAADFADMLAAYRSVAPDPDHFEAFLNKLQVVVHGWTGWTPEQLGRITAESLLIIGDNDFIRLDHAVEFHRHLPNAHLAVLPQTKHMEVVRRIDLVLPMLTHFLG
ncbi:alpha/beta fold hydrolase [Crossiella cryophila]|uniref:Pimeloyl-ACP methyl ester carboxylesterase n=1 Tax=Crossiella cryophila TaxID=43355 RepID=A0A7W7CFJ3_9PSEU|nr:alpha/beta hydrolase [Crossiella cryophila]MBB4680292.1 pimeloyl-ACP methyl ester carboxylesterase [Crossiella cryophila]